jgi:maltose alpha-D-glucosyltransferase/alpha-amylase
VVDFWFQRGVDGLRLDAVPYLYEREGTSCENLPETHAFLRKLRAHIDARFQDRLLLAEANQWPEDAARYFGDGDECHMTFHFPIMPRLFMSIQMEDRFPIIDILRQTPKLPSICQWAMFLRNHDELTLEMVTDEERDYMYDAYAYEPRMRFNQGIRRRLAPLCGNDRRKMELLDALLFSMPGTPVLYYGDEIGMGDNVFLGDRTGVRTPMQWSPDRNAGFSGANPQRLDLPVIIDPEYHYETINVEAQQLNPNSLLWWTKRLIALRKRYRAFGRGTVEFVPASNPSVLAFVRRHEDEVILVVANLSRRVQYVEMDLSMMKGRVPTELLGRTRLPVIGDAPYLLTLGGHAFYWFSVEDALGSPASERMSRLGKTTLSITSPNELLSGSERSRLEDILPAFLDASGWLTGTVNTVHIIEAAQIEDAAAAFLVFIRVEYPAGNPENLMVPLIVLRFDADLAQFVGEASPTSPGALLANLRLRGETGSQPSLMLVLASREGAGRILLNAIARSESFKTSTGSIVAQRTPGARVDLGTDCEARLLSSDPLSPTIAYGTSLVLRLFYRSEEGIAPEIEVARLLENGLHGYMPRVLGWVERRTPNREPATIAILEEQVANQGSAWQQACDELERAYERVLARSAHEQPPAIPRQSLIELANVEPPETYRELIGTYRAWAVKLGSRVAGFHLALASSADPAFEPRAYSAMEQRSRYQSARNLVGRVVGLVRQSLGDLPAAAQELAGRVLAAEEEILARFEFLKTQPIDAKRIRIHGNLHLGRVLFTGRDFVFLGQGANRRRLSEGRRKASALRDIASMVRSFQYAATISLRSLRPEDQRHAEPWSWIWPRWASASFLRGYLDAAGNSPFVGRDPAVTAVLLETALLAQALRDVQFELRRRSATITIPLNGLLDILRRDAAT